MKTILLVLLLLYPLSSIVEAAEKKDPIDQAMEVSIEKDPSTAGMVGAYTDANAAWDKRMNVTYQSLKAKMQPKEWAALSLAQKAWLGYRDLQIKSINATFSRMEGSMWVPVSALKIMELTRERVLFLDSLLGAISER